jgi:GT2 family glycosyltransferase
MKIALIILNFNGLVDTQNCLKSLADTVKNNFELEIIVVNNDIHHQNDDIFKKINFQINVINNSKNLGFSGGNNIGIRYGLKNGADFVFIINNDTIVDKNCIQKLLDDAQKEKNIGIFGPKIYFASGYETHKEKYTPMNLGKVIWYAGGIIDWQNVLASHRGVDEVDLGQFDKISKTDFVTGCAMFIRRNVFEKIGLFDEKLFLYFEDVDFCIRAKKKGFNSYFIPQAYLWHKNAISSGGTGSDLQTYYMTRNRLIIGMRYAPWRTKLALFRENMFVLMKGNVFQKHAVGDFLRRKYGKC